MNAEVSLFIVGTVVSIVIAIVGYLVVRSVNAMDRQIELLGAEVKALGTKDTQTEIRMAEISVRLAHVEAELLALKRAAA
jgi:hypothetical protein